MATRSLSSIIRRHASCLSLSSAFRCDLAREPTCAAVNTNPSAVNVQANAVFTPLHRHEERSDSAVPA